MAGSGKTSLVQRLNAHLHEAGTPAYLINLDPAVKNVPYEANIDIRDTVNYKEVMQQYGLGPNGGIVTSLNLFATRFDQVLQLVEQRSHEHEYIVIDTPGQIEVFTWSASGAIVTESIAATMPSAVVYVIDTPRCTSPMTFMSNMLYACSIMYKTKLPFILAFNKTDVVSHQFAIDWMTDSSSFQDALDQEQSYAASLTRSMSVVLEQFYATLRAVGVSAFTGAGMTEFFEAVASAVKEYHEEYQPVLEARQQEKQARVLAEQQTALERLKLDMAQGGKAVMDVRPGRSAPHPDDELDSDDDFDAEEGTRSIYACIAFVS